MFAGLGTVRTLVWYLFERDFRAQYKQSFLGYSAVLAPPLITAAIFTFVARTRIVPIGATTLPYPMFVLLGLTVWGLFAGVVTAGTSSLSAAANLLHKMNFPREAIVVAAAGRPLTETLIRCVPLALLAAWLHAPVAWTVVLVPLVLAPLVLFALGVAFVASILNGVSRDVAMAVGLALQIGMFLTPVAYPPPTTWPFVLVNHLNPVSGFLIAIQDLVSLGTLTQPRLLLTSSLIGVTAFLAGWRLFRLAQPLITERL